MNGLESRRKLRRRYCTDMDVDALSRLDETRRGVEAGAESSFMKNARDGSAGGTFTVRARDVNKTLSVFRVSQAGKKRAHGLQSELRAWLELVAQRIEISSGIGVTHLAPDW